MCASYDLLVADVHDWDPSGRSPPRATSAANRVVLGRNAAAAAKCAPPSLGGHLDPKPRLPSRIVLRRVRHVLTDLGIVESDIASRVETERAQRLSPVNSVQKV